MKIQQKKLPILGTAILLWIVSVFAQPPDTVWTRTYGGLSNDYGMYIQLTSDSGYIMVGWTESFGAGDYDVYLVKIDADGDTIWTKTYGGQDEDAGNWVEPTSDGGFIIAGYTQSFGAGMYDVYLIKTKANGDTIWTRTFGGTLYDQAWSVLETEDRGFLVAGFTASFGDPLYDIYLIKTDADGHTIWTRYYLKQYTQWPNSIKKTSDGGYIIAGFTGYYNDWDAYLMKIDSAGNLQWDRNYGGRRDEYAWEVQPTSDEGYIFVGWTTSFGAGEDDIWLVKTDSAGDTLWTKTYGGDSSDKAQSVQPTPDKGYIIAGGTFSFGAGGADVYLIRTDSLGEEEWTKTYGGTDWDRGTSLKLTLDGGYIILGYTMSFGSGEADFFLLKTEPDTDIKENLVSHSNSYHLNLTISPNPFSEKVIIKYNIENNTKIIIRIYDVNGRLIRLFDHKPVRLSNFIIWDGTDDSGKSVPAGVYCIRLITQNSSSVARVVRQ